MSQQRLEVNPELEQQEFEYRLRVVRGSGTTNFESRERGIVATSKVSQEKSALLVGRDELKSESRFLSQEERVSPVNFQNQDFDEIVQLNDTEPESPTMVVTVRRMSQLLILIGVMVKD